jgi:hypothetical protein
MGTQPGGVLAKITYLVGAIFIVSTLLLTKLTLSSIHGTDTLRSGMSTSIQEASQDHSEHGGDVDEHAGHDHSQGTSGAAGGEGGTAMGMKAVDIAEEGKKSNENQ